MTSASPALRGRTVALLLTLYAAAILARMPQIVLKGRFWAEEGTVFLASAFQLDPLKHLFLSYGGYLNLLANASTLAARWAVPLADAPYATIGTALVCQLVPPALLLLARDKWLRPLPVRLAGLLLLLVVPASEEVWLQSLHCQFELAIGCGLVLALAVPGGVQRVVSGLALFLAPLCGPAALVLLPLFLLRALVERSRGRAGQFAILLLGSAIQLGLFFHPGSDRGLVLDLPKLLAVITVKDLIVPFIGVNTALGYSLRIQAAAAAGHVSWLVMLAPVLVFGTVAALSLRLRNAAAFWFLAGAATVAVAAYTGGLDGAVALMNPRAGARYAVVPLSLTALSFLALASRQPLRWPAAGICLWLAIVGLRAYVAPWPPAKDGPAWSAELAKWRADPAYPIQLWPAPSPWVVRLPAAAHDGPP